jgi:DNA-binding transcriptional LysR family regulator
VQTRLFQRTTRVLSLTEAGELFFAQAPALIAGAAKLLDETATVGQKPVGTVRLTASVAFGETCLIPLLERFHKPPPGLMLDLVLTDARLCLITERIDLAIRLGEHHRGDLLGKQLFKTRYRVVASPNYIQHHDKISTPMDLADHQCLLWALPEFRSKWLFRDDTRSLDVPISGTFVVSNALALRSAVRCGVGPALLADWLIDADLKAGTLVDLFPSYHVGATSFDTFAWLLWAGRDYIPRKNKLVMHFFEENLRAHYAR